MAMPYVSDGYAIIYIDNYLVQLYVKKILIKS